MKQSEWLLLLFREAAAVPIAVHEVKHGRNAVPSRPLQALGMLISTAGYSHTGKRTQISCFWETNTKQPQTLFPLYDPTSSRMVPGSNFLNHARSVREESIEGKNPIEIELIELLQAGNPPNFGRQISELIANERKPL